jgi:hypothetical protein
VADERRLDADPPRPDRGEEFRPPAGQVVVAEGDPGLGRLAAGLGRVAAVGEDHQLVRGDKEAAGIPGHLLLAVGQGEAGQVAHVLGPGAEVGVEPIGREPFPDAGETCRACRAVRLGPAVEIRGARRRGEVGGLGQGAHR